MSVKLRWFGHILRMNYSRRSRQRIWIVKLGYRQSEMKENSIEVKMDSERK